MGEGRAISSEIEGFGPLSCRCGLQPDARRRLLHRWSGGCGAAAGPHPDPLHPLSPPAPAPGVRGREVQLRDARLRKHAVWSE